MRSSSFLVAVHRLSAGCGSVFVDLALYLAVGGLCLGGAFLAFLPFSCFKHVWHRFLGCLSLLCGEALHALFLSLSLSLSLSLLSSSVVGSRWCNIVPGDCAAVCSTSAPLHPATELRSARGWASACSAPRCESSSGPSVLTHCTCGVTDSFLHNLDLFLKLFDMTSTRSFHGCPHFIWVIFLCVELETQILRLFSLRSHAPCATERQCLVSKG